MEDRKNAGQQAEDWELSEEYYKEETGKKELRLEDFLETETGDQEASGLNTASSVAMELEAMTERVKQVINCPGQAIRQTGSRLCLTWMTSRYATFWCVSSPSRRMIRLRWHA